MSLPSEHEVSLNNPKDKLVDSILPKEHRSASNDYFVEWGSLNPSFSSYINNEIPSSITQLTSICTFSDYDNSDYDNSDSISNSTQNIDAVSPSIDEGLNTYRSEEMEIKKTKQNDGPSMNASINNNDIELKKNERDNKSRTSISTDDSDVEIKDSETFQVPDVEMGIDEKKNDEIQNLRLSTETTNRSVKNMNICSPIKEVCPTTFCCHTLDIKPYEDIVLEKDLPTLILREKNQVVRVTCPWLWHILGDRYGTPLSQSFNENNENIENSENTNLVDMKFFDSCQVNATSIYITGQDLSHESVLNFIYKCRSYRRHVYTFRFPKISIPTTRSKFETEINEFVMQIVDCAIECWYLGWQVIVFVDASSIENSFISKLLHGLRYYCDEETLDVVVLVSKFSAKVSEAFLKAGSSVVVTNTNKFLEKLKLTANQETIKFYEKYEKYYDFTNFSYSYFKKDGYSWSTSEHYFQAHKFTDDELFNRVRLAFSPRTAFDIGHSSPNVRADWDVVDEDGIPYKERVMMEGVYAKFTYNRSLTLKLLSTGGANLVEHTKKDGYWGDNGDGTGKNRLGVMLEDIRDLLFLEELERINSTDYFEERALERARWYIEDLRDSLESGSWWQ